MKEKKKAFLIRAGLILASAILLRISFPGWGLYPLAFVGLIPFFIVIKKLEKPGQGFWWGLLLGFLFHYANTCWLNAIAVYNAFVYFGIIIMGIYLALFVGLFGWGAVHLLKRFPRTFFLTAPALWVLLEYLRNMGQLAFPWSYLSASQIPNHYFIQIADITGVWGISFLIVLTNIAILEKFSVFKKHKSYKPIPSEFVAVILIALAYVYGIDKGSLQKRISSSPPLSIAILQPDIPQKKKYSSYADPNKKVRDDIGKELAGINFKMLADLKPADADLIIFPESAFTNSDFQFNAEMNQRLLNEAKRLSAGILLGANRLVLYNKNGAIARRGEDIADVGAYNSAWYFRPDDALQKDTYDKMQLVPFGEHLPYFDLIPGFQKFIVQTGSFLKGQNYTLMPVFQSEKVGNKTDEANVKVIETKTRFGTVICFESAFGRLFRNFSNKGADFMVIITNDGWYGDSAGPYQHFDLAVFRAIETRRWVLRSANRGISAFISPEGIVARKSKLNEKKTLLYSINPPTGSSSETTIYQRIGDSFVLLMMLFLAGHIAFHHIRKRKGTKKIVKK